MNWLRPDLESPAGCRVVGANEEDLDLCPVYDGTRGLILNNKIAIGAGAVLFSAAAVAELGLIYLGQTYGSTPEERRMSIPGDDMVPDPQVVTNHAININAPPEAVWPWLVQMGWHRAGWYTARWVDKLLFPANWPNASRIIPGLQEIKLGDFIPDGARRNQVRLGR
jgi:hypothetical protein